MDSAWISAFSAVMGSLVGGFTTFVTTYANQRSQYRRDFLSKQFAKRESDRLIIDTVVSKYAASAPAVSRFGGIILSQCAAARVSLDRRRHKYERQ
jgi:membrane protein YqaA with SNARE-associated domain